MKFPPVSIAQRLVMTVLLLVGISGIGFAIVIQSLSSAESIIKDESSEHVDLLTINSTVSRQVFELTTRVQLLEQAFLYNESMLKEEGFSIDQQLQKMRELSSDAQFSQKMDYFIEDFHRFLGNSLTLNRIIYEMKQVDNDLAQQIDQLDFAVSNSKLESMTAGNFVLNNNLDLVYLLRESFLTIGKQVGTIRSRITPETEKVVIIEVQKELDIFQLHLANLKNTNEQVKKEKTNLRRILIKYGAALRKMQANLDQRWEVMDALVHSQNELLAMVEFTESSVQRNALSLTKQLEANISRSRLHILVIAILSVCSGLLLISRVVRLHIQAPLNQLRNGFQQLETSELQQRISLGRSDEWSSIENAFNKMANRLEETYSQLNDEKKNFNFLAHHDPLTGLANRLLIMQELETVITTSQRRGDNFTVLYLDIDEFKTINDSLGHAAGDKLLVDVSLTLSEIVGYKGKVARMGGDEFLVLLDGNACVEDGKRIAQKINESVRKPYTLEDKTVFVSASIGICQYPEHGATVETIVRNADTAMYYAKRNGRDQYVQYIDCMTNEANHLIDITAGLRQALINDELEVQFQPQVDLISGRILGAEALVRWNHPTFGQLAPAEFLGIAEKTGLIVDIDDWVFNRVVTYIEQWIAEGIDVSALHISVNFSGRKFYTKDLALQLCRTLHHSTCKPEYLTLEITERDMMGRIDVSSATIAELRKKGFSIAIDDFGTGHSSLSLLKNLEANTLKLDKSFIQDIGDSNQDFAIVQAVMRLAKELKLEVIAEGVELQKQRDRLIEIGCTHAQGYYYSESVTETEWLSFVKRLNS